MFFRDFQFKSKHGFPSVILINWYRWYILFKSVQNNLILRSVVNGGFKSKRYKLNQFRLQECQVYLSIKQGNVWGTLLRTLTLSTRVFRFCLLMHFDMSKVNFEIISAHSLQRQGQTLQFLAPGKQSFNKTTGKGKCKSWMFRGGEGLFSWQHFKVASARHSWSSTLLLNINNLNWYT